MLSLAPPPLYRDNCSITRTGAHGEPRRKLAEVNGIAPSPLEKVGDVMLQNRAVEAPWRSSLARSNKRSACGARVNERACYAVIVAGCGGENGMIDFPAPVGPACGDGPRAWSRLLSGAGASASPSSRRCSCRITWGPPVNRPYTLELNAAVDGATSDAARRRHLLRRRNRALRSAAYNSPEMSSHE